MPAQKGHKRSVSDGGVFKNINNMVGKTAGIQTKTLVQNKSKDSQSIR